MHTTHTLISCIETFLALKLFSLLCWGIASTLYISCMHFTHACVHFTHACKCILCVHAFREHCSRDHIMLRKKTPGMHEREHCSRDDAFAVAHDKGVTMRGRSEKASKENNATVLVIVVVVVIIAIIAIIIIFFIIAIAIVIAIVIVIYVTHLLPTPYDLLPTTYYQRPTTYDLRPST